MAAPSLKMERVINYLIDVYQRCEKKRGLVEHECQDFRKLLKPWPSNLDPTGTKKVETLNSKNQVGKGGAAVDVISEQEAEDLSLLEDLLGKAQKARERQAKVESRIAKKEKKFSSRPPLPPINKTEKTSHVEDKENTERIEDKSHSDGCTAAVISQSSLERILGMTKGQTSGKGNTAAKATVKSGVVKRPTSTSRTKPGAVRQQYKTSSAEIGKHAKSQQTSRTRGNVPGHKIQAQGKSQPNSRSGSADRSTALSQRSRSVERGMEVHGSGSLPNHPNVDSVRTSSTVPTRPITGLSNEIDAVSSQTEELYIEESSTTSSVEVPKNKDNSQSKDIEDKQADQQFLLSRDGSTLCVPVKLKRLYSTHHKFQQKISTLIEKQPSMNSQQQFIDRLKSTFPAEAISLSREDLVRQVEDMKNEYHHLIALTEKTIGDMAELTEKSSWQELYRASVMINQIKGRHQQMQDELQNLSLGEHQLRVGCPCGDCTTVQKHLGLVAVQQTDKLLVPPSLESKELFDSPWEPAGETPSNLIYDDVRQLKQIVTLQHDIALLQIQMQIQKLISEELLPLLQDVNPTDGGYIEFYRSVYALLYHDGKMFPAVIKDSIDNDSD